LEENEFFSLSDNKFVTGSRFSISKLVLPVYNEDGALKNRAMVSCFSVNYNNGRDILKIFACSEAHQQSGDFFMHWYVSEMSKSIK
jgi:hypothetical protein